MPATKWGAGVGLEFDEATHAYQFNGVAVPSVTQILKAAGCLPDMKWATEFHLDRGTQVHKACEIDDEGELDYEALDPRIQGYVDAWRSFRKMAGPELEILGIEQRGYNSQFRYAGTKDRVIRLGGRLGVLDIKTGQPAPWHSLQLAGYSGLVVGATERMSVYLAKNGTFKVAKSTDRNDWYTFTAAASLWHWRDRAGLHRNSGKD